MTSNSRLSSGAYAALLVVFAACGSDDAPSTASQGGPASAGNPEAPGTESAPAPGPSGAADAAAASPFARAYLTSTVTMGDDQSTYTSVLTNLEAQTISIASARESLGWASQYAHQGQVFFTEGDAPVMRRYDLRGDGSYSETGSISFLNHGASYAESTFVAPDKAYVFADDAIVWNPSTMTISGTFKLPEIADRPAGMKAQGVSGGRGLVVRGNRTYVATSWANWDEYTVSEDSLIVVIDNERNEVIGQIPVPCPYVDVGTLSDEGHVYFSNWVYSLAPTLLHGKKKACAVRIPPGSDALDPTWSLTFADVTEGREAAALRYIGGGKAVISVFHQERVDLAAQKDPAELTNQANWRLWTLDLETKQAAPLEGVEFNAGGGATERVDGRTFLMMPAGDYTSTTVYEILPSGEVSLRWKVEGWSTQIARLR